jgi:MFS family permease
MHLHLHYWDRRRIRCAVSDIRTDAPVNRLEPLRSQHRDWIHVSRDAGTNTKEKLTTRRFLMFGWSCLFWHPVALRCGKRPVFLVSILATTATQIWAPHATSNLQWTFNRIIQGFFGGPVEFLCQVSLADIFFHHERGDKIAWYAASLGGSSFAAPIAAGFIERGQEWEWVLYWAGILCAIGFLLLLFFMEETNFKRHAGNDTIATTTLRQNVLSATTQVTETQFGADEKTSSWWTISNLMQITRKKYLNRVLSDMSRPVQMLRFPLLCFAGFLYGSNLIWFNALNATTSLVFGGHAYEFLPWSIGLTYLSPMAGAILASIYTGLLGDKLGLWIARRNNGNLEAEYRLWLLAPCLMILPSGLILWGVGQ